MKIPVLIAFACFLQDVSRAGAPETPVELGAKLKAYGYAAAPKKEDAAMMWTRAGFSIGAEEDTACITLGGTLVWLDSAVSADEDGRLFIRQKDFEKTVAPIIAPASAIARPIRTIALDAGHGGKDPGNSNTTLGLAEKNLTAEVVGIVKSRLEKAGYRVVLIRPSDMYIPRQDRDAFANAFKPDLFVSVHFNAAADKGAHGVETFCLTPAFFRSTNDQKAPESDFFPRKGNVNDASNILFAYYMQHTLIKTSGMNDRGVRRGRWDVLTDIACPAVLVECGFLSNEAEAGRISDPDYRRKNIAAGISEAIVQYHAKLVSLAAKR